MDSCEKKNIVLGIIGKRRERVKQNVVYEQYIICFKKNQNRSHRDGGKSKATYFLKMRSFNFPPS